MSLALRQSPLPGRIIPLEECVCTYRFGTQNNFKRALSQQVGSIRDAREMQAAYPFKYLPGARHLGVFLLLRKTRLWYDATSEDIRKRSCRTLSPNASQVQGPSHTSDSDSFLSEVLG